MLSTQGWDHHGAEVQKCGIFDDSTFGLGVVLPRQDGFSERVSGGDPVRELFG